LPRDYSIAVGLNIGFSITAINTPNYLNQHTFRIEGTGSPYHILDKHM